MTRPVSEFDPMSDPFFADLTRNAMRCCKRTENCRNPQECRLWWDSMVTNSKFAGMGPKHYQRCLREWREYTPIWRGDGQR
jgi:hypothetical protein